MATRYNIKNGRYITLFDPHMKSAIIGKIKNVMTYHDEAHQYQIDAYFSNMKSPDGDVYLVSTVFTISCKTFDKKHYHDLIISIFANLEASIKGI
jgi:hypothetical protein